MNYLPEQARAFYAALTGEVDPSLTFQTFYDPDNLSVEFMHLRSWWNGKIDPTRLSIMQKQHAGVFACVNGSSTGGRKKVDIDQFRALFVDADGAAMPAAWPTYPHAINMRDATHWHCYWFIDGNVSADEWQIAQYHMALYYNGDVRMSNVDRVTRIPGYFHQKDAATPRLYYTHHLDKTGYPRYTVAQVLQAHPLNAIQMGKLAEWITKRNHKFIGGLEGFDDCGANQASYVAYLLNRAPVAVEGQGGDHCTFTVAAAGKDYALTPDMTYTLMVENWNERCSPPWDEADLRVKINNAYTHSMNAIGNRAPSKYFTTDAIPLEGMSATPVAVAPIHVDKKGKEIPVLQAPTLSATDVIQAAAVGVYEKNHTRNARVFIAQHSPNGEVVIKDEDTFMYNGKCYEPKDKSWVHATMTHAMEYSEPQANDISGSTKIATMLLTDNNNVAWPYWENDTNRDASGLIVFNNGILDTRTNEWFTHTPKLRCYNALPYDFDHKAKCPTWEKFLWSIWGDSKYEPLIEALQLWFGYMLVPDVSQQKMAIITGKPRGGKGTIMRIARAMLGEFNSIDPSLANLSVDAHLHQMSKKLAAFLNDVTTPTGNAKEVIVSNIKRIVGMDAVAYNRKYKDAISSVFTCRLMLTANEIPNLSESSSAMVNRGLFFHCPRSFSDNPDTTLNDRLSAEMGGIVNWAIKGLRRLQAGEKLRNDSCMDERIRLFMAVTSPIDVFLSDNVKFGEHLTCNVMALYKRFNAWNAENGSMSRMSMSDFTRAMDASVGLEAGFGSKGERIFRGASLVDHDVPDYGEIPV